MSAPTTTRAWSIQQINADSFNGLELKENVPLAKLGDHHVLVKMEAVSLNYRELAIPRVWCISFYQRPSFVLATHIKPPLTQITPKSRAFTPSP